MNIVLCLHDVTSYRTRHAFRWVAPNWSNIARRDSSYTYLYTHTNVCSWMCIGLCSGCWRRDKEMVESRNESKERKTRNRTNYVFVRERIEGRMTCLRQNLSCKDSTAWYSIEQSRRERNIVERNRFEQMIEFERPRRAASPSNWRESLKKKRREGEFWSSNPHVRLIRRTETSESKSETD